MKKSLLLYGGVLCLFATPAFAYIDPGMGSMWIQTLITLIAGAVVTLKMYWQRFKTFFYKHILRRPILTDDNYNQQNESLPLNQRQNSRDE